MNVMINALTLNQSSSALIQLLHRKYGELTEFMNWFKMPAGAGHNAGKVAKNKQRSKLATLSDEKTAVALDTVMRCLIRVHKWCSWTKYNDINGPTRTTYVVISGPPKT